MNIFKGNKWIYFIFIISFFTTAFSIYWIYNNILNNEKEQVISNFPYIQTSLIISMITFLFARIHHLENRLEISTIQRLIGKSNFLFYFIITGITIILYPGNQVLKIGSDNHFLSVLFAIGVIQTLTFSLLTSEIKTDNQFIKKVFRLIIISVLIIFSTKFLLNTLPKSNNIHAEHLDYQ